MQQQQQEEDQAGAAADPDPAPSDAAILPARNATSKYDFVKVKVWLGENADHYYVLPRFLLSSMLTVTSSQSDLEANLFKLMEKRGYGEDYINRYKMMTRFHHQIVPLVILVCGTACTGKSTIATQLAQWLNLPNVLQTDMVYELLRTSTDALLTSVPVWARDFNSSEELMTEFCRECRFVRKGLAGDLKKAMKDGKPIIIECREYIWIQAFILWMRKKESIIPGWRKSYRIQKIQTSLQKGRQSINPKNGLSENKVSSMKENEHSFKSPECMPEEGRISEGLPYANSHGTDFYNSAHSKEKGPKDEADGHKDLDQKKKSTGKKDKECLILITRHC